MTVLALGAVVAFASTALLGAAGAHATAGARARTVASLHAGGRSAPAVAPLHAEGGSAPAVAPLHAQGRPAAASLGRPESARSTAFSIDLYRPGDFVGQATPDFCIPAAILTMNNIAILGARHSVAAQRRLYRRARQLSSWRLVGGGAEAEGWAGALNGLGRGQYAVVVQPTPAAALRTAATALRQTGRPVGLVVWRGAHAWVMSGFRSTADPALTNRFAVTHVHVEDPWYPRHSSLWGPSLSPDSTVSVAALSADFLPFHRPTVRYPDKDGRFVLVLPVPERQAVRPVADAPQAVAPYVAARRLMQ